MYSNHPILMASVSAVTSSRGVTDPQVGDVVTFGDEKYVYVYNNSANTVILPGNGCTLTGVTGYSVNVTTTTGVDVLVGICKHATIATNYYGWLVTKGFTPVYPNVSCVTGDLLQIGATGGFVIATNTTGYVNNQCVKAMESLATGTAGYAYVSL